MSVNELTDLLTVLRILSRFPDDEIELKIFNLEVFCTDNFAFK